MKRRPRRTRAVAVRGSSGADERDLSSSLVVVFPLLFLYQLAIVVTPAVVATDPVSRALYAACHGRTGYLLVQAALAIGFLWWMHASGRARALSLSVVAPVIVESTAIALVLWLGLPILLSGVFGLGSGATLVSAVGAGVYEELAFRLFLLGGLLRLARSAELSPRVAAVAAICGAALAFAAAHHLGAAGEPWRISAFAYRFAAGLALGATAHVRSLAHAVYAHVVYDVLVLLA